MISLEFLFTLLARKRHDRDIWDPFQKFYHAQEAYFDKFIINAISTLL